MSQGIRDGRSGPIRDDPRDLDLDGADDFNFVEPRPDPILDDVDTGHGTTTVPQIPRVREETVYPSSVVVCVECATYFVGENSSSWEYCPHCSTDALFEVDKA